MQDQHDGGDERFAEPCPEARYRAGLGREHVARERYDVVILDQTMPGITGLSLARELSAARPGLPVVLYTGNGEHLRREDLAAAGVRAVLAKPVEPDQLHGLLRSLLP